MKRPLPDNSAASSTRSIERPIQALSCAVADEGVAAGWPIWRCLAVAAFMARLQPVLENPPGSGHTAHSHDLPMRPIRYAAMRQTYQLANRETARNSLGETPV